MTSVLNWLSQVLALIRLGLQTIPRRRGSSLAAVFGNAGVVAVLIGVLSIAQGFKQTMEISGSPATAMVMRTGATGEMDSIINGTEAKLIANAPGIAASDNGPLVSAELFVIIDLPKRSTGTSANVPFRGVQPAGSLIRKDFTMVQGRFFEWGRNEVIVGQGAMVEFAGLDLGDTIDAGGTTWTVVGIFSSGGGIAESEVWTDAAVLQPTYQRGNSFQVVYAKLTSADAFPRFADELTADPRLQVKVLRQTDFYAEQAQMITGIVSGLGVLITLIMACGAVFGALNTMYSAVSARTREIATLRALGFKAAPVVISVLVESLSLAVVGGVVGGGLAFLAFDGFRASTINWASFSQVAFAFEVTPTLLFEGIVCSSVIGLLGGIAPGVRAARLPIATALREL